MFEGFTEEFIAGDGANLFVRQGGPEGAPPVVLLHGYPQTSAMWHGVAPILARDYRVICPDLRGYGRSDKPESVADHSTYSKRAMAADIVAMMANLGHRRFLVGSHDRGARVAHRLALDHPDTVAAMTLLDIAPTREMYANTDMEFAAAYWHWFFLIQKAPIPESIIGADPENYWRHKCFDHAGGGGNSFAPDALAEYLEAFADPEAIRGSCEDYRAAATIDIAHDDSDGARKVTAPMEVYWAKGAVIDRCFDALALWRQRAETVTGEALPGSHYLAEDDPVAIAARMKTFFDKHPV